MGLTIVPLSLRRVIFSHFHAGPTGCHIGEYNHYSVSTCDLLGLEYGVILNFGSSNVPTAVHIICGATVKVNFIFLTSNYSVLHYACGFMDARKISGFTG